LALLSTTKASNTTSSSSSPGIKLDRTGSNKSTKSTNSRPTSATSTGNSSARRGTYFGTYSQEKASDLRRVHRTLSSSGTHLNSSVDSSGLNDSGPAYVASLTDSVMNTSALNMSDTGSLNRTSSLNRTKPWSGTPGTPGRIMTGNKYIKSGPLVAYGSNATTDRSKAAARAALIQAEKVTKKKKSASVKRRAYKSMVAEEEKAGRLLREEQHRKRQEYLLGAKQTASSRKHPFIGASDRVSRV
jgi:hypothetical protein